MALKIYKFNLFFKAVDTIHLPEFSGSSFRGVFGHSLKSLACVNLNEKCTQCPMVSDCIYTQIFDSTNLELQEEIVPGVRNMPHPFVIRIPKTVQNVMREGEILMLQLIIFGNFIEWSHYFFKALQNMGKIGIGKGNGKFELLKIVDSHSKNKVFEKTNFNNVPEPILIKEKSTEFVSSAKIEFLTPMRILKNHQAVFDITPKVLFNSTQRRWNIINGLFGDGETQDFRDDISKYQSETASRLRKVEIQRYSNRKQMYIPIDGVVGEMELRNLSPNLFNLLKIGEAIHIGKSTTMGLGQIKVWT